jgi:hypothetical protein
MSLDNAVKYFDTLISDATSYVILRRYDAARDKALDALAYINSQWMCGIIDETLHMHLKTRLGDVALTLLIAMHQEEADTSPPTPKSELQ